MRVLVRAFRLAGGASSLCRPIHVFAALAEGGGPVAAALSSGNGILPNPADSLEVDEESAGSLVGRLQRAAQQFASERGTPLVPGHLFLAGIDQSDPEAITALDQAGLDIAVLRTTALEMLREPPDLPPLEMPPLIRRLVSDQPVVTGRIEWGQEPVTSAADLASALGDTVWVPQQWPSTLGDPQFVLLRFPGAERDRDGYYVNGLNESEAPLIVSGHRRHPGGNLESELGLVAEKPFETLSRPEGSKTHVVVRTPVFDVHLSGSAISRAEAIDLAVSLQEVPPAD